MKKLLFMLLCCCIFVLGCNNQNDEIFEIEEEDSVMMNNDENNDSVEDINSLFEEGQKELDNSNFQKAIDLFSEALRLNPEADWIYGDRGRAKYNSGDPEGAIQDFSKAIELNKGKSVYYIWRSDAYDQVDKSDLAEADRAEAAKLPQE